jgi:hypothetical protein
VGQDGAAVGGVGVERGGEVVAVRVGAYRVPSVISAFRRFEYESARGAMPQNVPNVAPRRVNAECVSVA